MGIRRIVWKGRAKQNHIRIAIWYRENVAYIAALHYLQGIERTINILAQMPTIGMVNRQLSMGDKVYYEYVAHPRYIITYRFTSRTLYIVGVRSTWMKG